MRAGETVQRIEVLASLGWGPELESQQGARKNQVHKVVSQPPHQHHGMHTPYIMHVHTQFLILKRLSGTLLCHCVSENTLSLLPCSCPPRSKVVKVIPAIVSSSEAKSAKNKTRRQKK